MEAQNIKFVEYAGFWIRFVAYLIDSFILFLVQGTIDFLIFKSVFVDTSKIGLESQLLYIGINMALGVVYFAGMESSKNMATLGKMALDLRVVKENGEQLTFINAVGRYFAKILSAIILLIGYIMAAFDSRKQALHDKLAHSLVIVTNE